MPIQALLRKLLLIPLVLVTLGRLAAAPSGPFYVSPAGHDGNPGTLEQPFRTLERARDAVRDIGPTLTGDVAVFLRGGTHIRTQTFALEARDGGRSGFKVIYRNYPGESPVVSGGVAISGWVRDRDLWKANVGPGRETRQLYVNGRRATRARSAGTIAGAQRTSTGYTTTDTSLQHWANIQDAEVVINSLWRQFRCGISAVSGTTITLDQPCWTLVNSGFPVRLIDPVYVENAFELLDTPGEWFLNRQTGWLYYWPRPGEDMTAAEVILPSAETLVRVAGTPADPVHDLRFEGLTFAHAGWTRPSNADGFAELQANWHFTSTQPGLTRMPAALEVNDSQAVTFERNTFAHLGAAGLSLGKGSRDDIVSGNQFFDISATAMMLGDIDNANETDARLIPSNNQITNNYVHDAAIEYQSGIGIWIGYARGTRVAHNELHDLPYTAISIGSRTTSGSIRIRKRRTARAPPVPTESRTTT